MLFFLYQLLTTIADILVDTELRKYNGTEPLANGLGISELPRRLD